MSGGDTGVCWCASGDSKCPHAINSRINSLWNEMEASVDEVLEQFDRRSIKKYLSKEHKPSQTEKVRNCGEWGRPRVRMIRFLFWRLGADFLLCFVIVSTYCVFLCV
jgi:hypothetical protein